MEPKPSVTWTKKRNPIIKILAVLLVISLLGIGAYYAYTKFFQPKPADKTVESPPVATIKVTDKGFEPASFKVKQGTVVTWEVSTSRPIVIASNPYPKNDGLADLRSEQLGSGGTYKYKFDKAGTYGFHDDLNPTTNATIIVE